MKQTLLKSKLPLFIFLLLCALPVAGFTVKAHSQTLHIAFTNDNSGEMEACG